jgi:hypothetical protein
VKKGFMKFLNVDSSVMAEYLAKFLDFHLKKTSKSTIGMNDEDLESKVRETIYIFKLIESKDTFESFYMRALSRRLLLQKSASFEAEKVMFSRLRSECSNEFTTKTENMLKDLTESEAFLKEYTIICGGTEAMGKMYDNIDSSFQVLSAGSWPIGAQISSIIYPEPLQTIQENFRKHYGKKHQGKVLQFAPQMSTCLIFGNFMKKPNGTYGRQH